jgi:plastocyanin
VVFVLVAAAFAMLASACASDAGASSEATIVIRYSRFAPETITAHAGEPITITLRNDDPIEHEWIVGPSDMHARHRTGTEPYHDAIPTEVTVPALSERVTTVTFDEPGEYAYICHLPRHEAYGMVGIVRVVEGP